MAAPAIEQSVAHMEAELPVIVLSYQFLQNYTDAGDSCATIYSNYGFDNAAYTDAICANEMFNFKDPLTTCFALVNIYLNNDTYAKEYAENFYAMTQIPFDTINTVLFGDTSWFVNSL